jgi:GNAT superfamily N-acetyltransferase
VIEISSEVWEGNKLGVRDYLPDVFDEWVADPGATFQAAEMDGLVVGVQRLRPIARHLAYYEGLRVAASHRRQGIARAMLGQAAAEARGLGFTQMRLITGNPHAAQLFRSEGFRLLTECGTWAAQRMEGGDPPHLASPVEAARLAESLRGSPALAAYGGVNPAWDGPLDVDAALLEHLTGQGLVRAAAGGRGLALIWSGSRRRLRVTFLGGSGAAVQDLLMALRFEADSMDAEGVRVLIPASHPAAADLAEVGYHLADDEVQLHVFELPL